MNRILLEAEIIDLIQNRIASACVNGERDWNLKQGYPIPTPAEVLEEAVAWDEDYILADLLNLSVALCCEYLSLYHIDNDSDLEARSLWLDRQIEVSTSNDMVCYVSALYSGTDEDAEPPDPTTSPFYYQDDEYLLAA